MFLYLIAFLAVLSAILAWADISVTEDVAVPLPTDGSRTSAERSADRSCPTTC